MRFRIAETVSPTAPYISRDAIVYSEADGLFWRRAGDTNVVAARPVAYKSQTLRLQGAGVADPTAVTLSDDIGAAPALSRTAQGVYQIRFTDAEIPDAAKAAVFVTVATQAGTEVSVRADVAVAGGNADVTLTTADAAGAAQDGIDAFVEIRSYA